VGLAATGAKLLGAAAETLARLARSGLASEADGFFAAGALATLAATVAFTTLALAFGAAGFLG